MQKRSAWAADCCRDSDSAVSGTETVKEGLGDLRSTVAGKLGGKRTGSDMEIPMSEGGGGGAGFTTAPP